MSEKLIIIIANLLIYYLIIKISYIKLLLIIKLIFIGIEIEVFEKISYTYKNLAKFKKETKFN